MKNISSDWRWHIGGLPDSPDAQMNVFKMNQEDMHGIGLNSKSLQSARSHTFK